MDIVDYWTMDDRVDDNIGHLAQYSCLMDLVEPQVWWFINICCVVTIIIFFFSVVIVFG